MTDFGCVSNFRREPLAESCLRAFQSDTPVEFLIQSFINDSHAALRDFTDDAKPLHKTLSELEGMLHQLRRAERFEQKAAHPALPLEVGPNTLEQLTVTFAGSGEESFPLVFRPCEGTLDEAHDDVIILRFARHGRLPC